MTASAGAATQIYSPQFDRTFFSLPLDMQRRLVNRIDVLGCNLSGPHYRMQGVDAFRLRVGDFRIVYQFNLQKNELYLIAVGHRREVYKSPLN